MTLINYKLDHPWVLIVLFLVLALYLIVVITARRRSAIAYPPLQYKEGNRLFKLLFGAILTLELTLIITLFLSLAKPYKSTEIVTIEEKGIDVLLAVDVSASMQATDFQPNRLEATKKIITDFVRRGTGHRIGVVVFAKHVFTLSPMTTDPLVLSDLIAGLSLKTIDHYVSGGTAIGNAILRSTDILRNIKIPGRDQIVILLTDGDSNFGIDTKLAARFAFENNVRVNTIGLGSTTPVNVKPDPANPTWIFETRLLEEPMQEIAKITQGQYFHAGSESVLNEIFVDIAKLEQSPLEIDKISQKKYVTYPLNLITGMLFVIAIVAKVIWLRRPLR